MAPLCHRQNHVLHWQIHASCWLLILLAIFAQLSAAALALLDISQATVLLSNLGKSISSNQQTTSTALAGLGESLEAACIQTRGQWM